MAVAPTHPHQLILNGFLNEKKNALRDFAAFHFMSTNKRIKKPFWRDEWEAEGAGRGSRKSPLQNRTRRKRGQEAGGPADGAGKKPE